MLDVCVSVTSPYATFVPSPLRKLSAAPGPVTAIRHADLDRFRYPRQLGRPRGDRPAVRRLPLSGRPGRLRTRPGPCVRWAMKHATYAIRGNHDHGVAQGIPVTGETGFRYLTQASRPSMWDALGPEERRYLLQLPVTQRVHAGRQAVSAGARHATRPARRVPAQGPADLGQAAAQRRGRRRVRGPHPHSVQDSGQRCGRLNPGSVGLPRDGDPARPTPSSTTTRSR